MDEKYQKAGIILSIIAIMLSFANMGYEIYKDTQSKVEALSVSTSKITSDYKTEIIEQNISGYPAILPTWYRIVLINNGDRPINVIDYNLQQITGTITQYSNMDIGLFDRSGQQIEFPLNLKPQDSIAFNLRVGLLINPKAFKTIQNNSISKNETNIYLINSLLAKNGMDLYGNSAEYIGEDNAYSISVSPNRTEQIFSITFITSNHKSFTSFFSWYND